MGALIKSFNTSSPEAAKDGPQALRSPRSGGVRVTLPDPSAAPEDASEIYRQRGNAAYGRGDIPAARGWYERALVLRPAYLSATPASSPADRLLRAPPPENPPRCPNPNPPSTRCTQATSTLGTPQRRPPTGGFAEYTV